MVLWQEGARRRGCKTKIVHLAVVTATNIRDSAALPGNKTKLRGYQALWTT